MLTSERDLRDQISMLEDAIAEGSPYTDRLRVLHDQRVAALSRAQGTQYRPTDDHFVGGNKQTPSGRTGAVRLASEKQVSFLRKLLAEKNTDGLAIPADVEQLSSKAASALIDRLLGRPAATTAPTAVPADLATDKQKSFLRKLLSEREVPEADAVDVDRITKWAASAIIDELVKLPMRSAAAELEAGAYLVDGRVIRVYVGQQSRRMLAQELVDATAQVREEAWSYLGMASRFVPADAHRMTVEECEAASAGTEDHGWCCVCGARLDDPNSVKRGIGPTCRAKQGAGL